MEIFTVVASSVTIFAFIVDVFSIYRRKDDQKRDFRSIISESEQTRKILDKITMMLDNQGMILSNITSILEKIYDKGR